MSRVEPAVSRLTQAPLPAPERMPPLPPDVLPPPPGIPSQRPPNIREPDLPGEHRPIGDGPRPAPAAPPAILDVVPRGNVC